MNSRNLCGAGGAILLAGAIAWTQPPQGAGPHGRGHGMGHGMGQGMQHGQHMLQMMGTLPTEMKADGRELTPARIDLGRILYYEPRLSKSKSVSCNTCHPLDRYGADGQRFSPGHEGKLGGRNAPTIYNAAGHLAQFWDGRAADVEAQAKGPVMNPVEMAMASEEEVTAALRAIPGYEKYFRKAFPGEAEPVTFDNMAIAIGAFERKLVTPSRWDRFQKGDRRALTDKEHEGWRVFHMTGCYTCHNGPYAGGSSYRKFGQVREFPGNKDLGRYEVTRSDADRMFFKVPSLRNAAKTGPYFHDGSVPSLDEAVRLMARHQLGQELNDTDVSNVVAFLDAMTGEIPRDYIKAPKLP
jgi:cytochrome c peroxidase